MSRVSLSALPSLHGLERDRAQIHHGLARLGERGHGEGVFAGAIGYPTVPQGKARIRVMVSAAHNQDDLERGLAAFEKVGKSLGVLRA